MSRVTVRTNIDRLVGGAGDETIIARIGEGMLKSGRAASGRGDVILTESILLVASLSRAVGRASHVQVMSPPECWCIWTCRAAFDHWCE